MNVSGRIKEKLGAKQAKDKLYLSEKQEYKTNKMSWSKKRRQLGEMFKRVARAKQQMDKPNYQWTDKEVKT